jgi:hypothetical protein
MFDKTAGLGLAISTSATSQLVDFHSFFACNALSGMTGPIVSATLSLYNPAGGHASSETSEMLTIDGFSGNLSTLEAGGRVPGECNALTAPELQSTFFAIAILAGFLVLARRPGVREIKSRQICA